MHCLSVDRAVCPRTASKRAGRQHLHRLCVRCRPLKCLSESSQLHKACRHAAGGFAHALFPCCAPAAWASTTWDRRVQPRSPKPSPPCRVCNDLSLKERALVQKGWQQWHVVWPTLIACVSSSTLLSPSSGTRQYFAVFHDPLEWESPTVCTVRGLSGAVCQVARCQPCPPSWHCCLQTVRSI